MTLRTARRATVLLCGLIIVFAGLTIAMKQYALVWWKGSSSPGLLCLLPSSVLLPALRVCCHFNER